MQQLHFIQHMHIVQVGLKRMPGKRLFEADSSSEEVITKSHRSSSKLNDSSFMKEELFLATAAS